MEKAVKNGFFIEISTDDFTFVHFQSTCVLFVFVLKFYVIF